MTVQSEHNRAVAGAANSGINFPRLYDFLIYVVTRGHDRAYRSAVLDLAGVAAGDKVLDVGCGTGTQTLECWRRVQPGGIVAGVDVSAKMLAAARRKARRAGCHADFRQADAAALPFADATFDVVTITTAMHMIPEARRCVCLGEAARVLRSSGRLLIIDYAGELAGRRHWMAKHGRHGQFDLRKVQPLLVQAGFEPAGGGPIGWLDLHFLRGIKR
jgi:ubiquinone/menaquinone biosynthesis C-methylase UbiE